jgi:hypothetical protein
LTSPAVAHRDQEIDDQLLEEGRRHLTNAFEKIRLQGGCQGGVAGFDLLLRRLILSRWAHAPPSFDRLDTNAALPPLEIGRIALKKSHVDALGLLGQHFATLVGDPVDASAYFFEQTAPLQEYVRPCSSVGKCRLAAAWQHLGKVNLRQRQVGSDAVAQVGR